MTADQYQFQNKSNEYLIQNEFRTDFTHK